MLPSCDIPVCDSPISLTEFKKKEEIGEWRLHTLSVWNIKICWGEKRQVKRKTCFLMPLCLTRDRSRMGMNFEICSSARNTCCGIGTHAVSITTANCSLTDNSHSWLQHYLSCLLIQDIFLVSNAACISTKTEIASPINCSIQLLKV